MVTAHDIKCHCEEVVTPVFDVTTDVAISSLDSKEEIAESWLPATWKPIFRNDNEWMVFF
jgi:hypothetical protein